ncbi:MAG: RNA 2',3'-cyclic phosphodiesterase [Patescibacteria group bacterium]
MADEMSREPVSVLDRPDTVARLFLGVSVPEPVKTRLQETAKSSFGQYIERIVPAEQWHLTLFFFGDVRNHAQYLGRLTLPLKEAFVPTITISHIGRGKARDQLWAYVNPTPALLNLREALNERLRKIHFPRPVEFRSFHPHIRLAKFYPVVRRLGIADVPHRTAYAIREAYLYRSTLAPHGSTYTIEATIPF